MRGFRDEPQDTRLRRNKKNYKEKEEAGGNGEAAAVCQIWQTAPERHQCPCNKELKTA